MAGCFSALLCCRMSVFVEKATKMGRSVSYISQLDRSQPLTLVELQEVVEKTSNERRNPLTAEYKTVPHNSLQSLSLTAEEKHKNRYRNVLPNPHTAVKLSDTGTEGSTYINANYIRGYGGREEYIATQGPITNTVPDFWRMVWEKDISIIVMTTPLVEKENQKCVKYWPSSDDDDTVTYGDMVVRNNFEEVTQFYKISYLSLYPLQQEGDDEVPEEKYVCHFWYTAWADFSVPSETASILKLREAVVAHKDSQSGPMVVHCSAGLGRSGAFMAIDMGIKQYEEEGRVDPLKYMCEMRQDRGGTIQTLDQYIYIHRVLLDYMISKPH